jgi:hypothetical protein
MLSKCANPVCDAKFQYLHSGKVYVIRYQARAHERTIGLEFSQEVERTVYVWLCADCSRGMKVQTNGKGEYRVVRVPNGG